MEWQNVLNVVYLLLNIYVFAVGALQGLLNYQAWKLIGPAEFPQVHWSIGRKTLQLYLPFFLLSLPLNFFMIWLRNPEIAQGLVVLVALLNTAIFVITVALMIPIQNRLDREKSEALLERLVRYHLYYRTFPGLVILLALAAMLYQLVRS